MSIDLAKPPSLVLQGRLEELHASLDSLKSTMEALVLPDQLRKDISVAAGTLSQACFSDKGLSNTPVFDEFALLNARSREYLQRQHDAFNAFWDNAVRSGKLIDVQADYIREVLHAAAVGAPNPPLPKRLLSRIEARASGGNAASGKGAKSRAKSTTPTSTAKKKSRANAKASGRGGGQGAAPETAPTSSLNDPAIAAVIGTRKPEVDTSVVREATFIVGNLARILNDRDSAPPAVLGRSDSYSSYFTDSLWEFVSKASLAQAAHTDVAAACANMARSLKFPLQLTAFTQFAHLASTCGAASGVALGDGLLRATRANPPTATSPAVDESASIGVAGALLATMVGLELPASPHAPEDRELVEQFGDRVVSALSALRSSMVRGVFDSQPSSFLLRPPSSSRQPDAPLTKLIQQAQVLRMG